MGGTLQIDPADYVAASRTMGTHVAATARSAGDGVTAELAGCHAMAGSDPAGLAWGAQYDPAAIATISATQDAVNAAYQLAGLLEQTGFNYSAAEQSSTIGAAPPAVDAAAYGAQRIVLTPPPSASGPNPAALPTAWSLIEGYLHRAWPNGHQDKLRAAAAAWNDSARFLYDASHGVADAVASIARQNSPEREDAITVCTSLRDALEGLGANHNCLSAACADYAGELDRAHREIEHELINLLEWTAGIEVAGAVTSVITFGLSEVVSQATVVARTSASAARILAIIDRLIALAQDAAQSIELFGVRAGELARTLTPILALERVVAISSTVEAVSSGRTSAIILDRLAVESSVDLSAVPVSAHVDVIDAIERARSDAVRFTGHDGKPYNNVNLVLPRGPRYGEWTAAASGAKRGPNRVIVAGEPSSPDAIYFWDHRHPPIRIGPHQ